MNCDLSKARAVLLLVSFFVLYSCRSGASLEEPMNAGGDMVEVSFSLVGTACRSSMSVGDDQVSSVKILAYSDGILLESAYFRETDRMSLSLERGRSYNLYALAGMGDPAVPSEEDELPEFRYRISGYADVGPGFPMCWQKNDFVPSELSSVGIVLTRLVTKVVLSVDSGDTGLEVSYVAIRQAPLSVAPFALSGSMAEYNGVSDGDMASSADITSLNNGGTAEFYVLENMQGRLIPGNTDPMKKVPSNMQDKADLCTFIEVGCSFPSGYDKEGTVVYRMYLGEDAVADFNLERNKVLDVMLSLTGYGLDILDSWKITPEYVQHAARVVLDRESLDLVVGKSGMLTAEVLPGDAVESNVEWLSTDASVAVVDACGTVTAVGEGACVVRAICKGRPEVSAECVVAVKDMVESLEIVPSQVCSVLGRDGAERYSEFKVNALYASGKSVDVTSVCGFSSDSGSASVPAGGVVAHHSRGEASIIVTYEGVSSVLKAVTEELAPVSVEFEQDRYMVSLGENVTVRYRMLFNDGTVSEYISYQLAQGYGWSCDGIYVADADVAEISTNGRVTACSVGQTVITVNIWVSSRQEYLRASSVLNVNEAYLMRVYASATPMFYDGTGGPSLIGVYSDGGERDVTCNAIWSSSDPDVEYTYSGGLVVHDDSRMITGETSVVFTGVFQGMSASASSVYGKWVRNVKFDRKQESAGYDRYRLLVVYDDYTEVPVSFEYQLSSGSIWTDGAVASESGVLVPRTAPPTRINAITLDEYYEYTGQKKRLSIRY